jgi:hypothetical protein
MHGHVLELKVDSQAEHHAQETDEHADEQRLWPSIPER